MATHYGMDEASKPGRDAMEVFRKLRQVWAELKGLRGCIIQLKDGASDFTTVASTYGYESEAEAEASFGEIDSAFSNADAAVTQMLDRHLYK
jgi:hypothetical protein